MKLLHEVLGWEIVDVFLLELPLRYTFTIGVYFKN